jgi:hypothetical protein
MIYWTNDLLNNMCNVLVLMDKLIVGVFNYGALLVPKLPDTSFLILQAVSAF